MFGQTLGGYYSLEGVAARKKAEEDSRLFVIRQANGPIAIGAPVSIDTATNTAEANPDGFLVVESDADNEGGGNIVGVYTGQNITNVPTNPSVVNGTNSDGSDGDGGSGVLSGKAAVAGDLIIVQVYGPAHVLAEGTTDIVVGDTLVPDTTAGRLVGGTDLTDGSAPQCQALGPLTEAAEGAIACYLRCA